jgi:hypothetical protein
MLPPGNKAGDAPLLPEVAEAFASFAAARARAAE